MCLFLQESCVFAPQGSCFLLYSFLRSPSSPATHILPPFSLTKDSHNPRKCLTNTPHPHAYSSVCGHPGVFLPTCCPARGLPLLDDQPSHPLSPCQGTFLVFSPPSVSRVFPTRVQTALVQCCPVELSTLMETFLSTWSCTVVTSYLRLWGT